MKNKRKELEELFGILGSWFKTTKPEKGREHAFTEIISPCPPQYNKKEQGLVKVQVILNPVDHPEFYNLRQNVDPIHIRLILERYGLHPCKTSVSEILPKDQSTTRSFDRRQSQDLDAEFRRLEIYNLLSCKERKDNPLDVVFSKDSHCPCPHCQSTRKQSKSGH